ncbi:AraC family two component transcriptional regulator [Cohnella sp. SGD-V74]|uniref:response regulator n=1 Tax=unclassified Cohnella TaxID=2636738 RepID=UPI000D47456C|nr:MULTISPECIES: response regulator [unclassified Cohnella]PRX66432.1 AraC family two component transcriptional regulator [Cohnella sp. SGD-V74]
MYNALIVDDEPSARDSLKYLIDWEEHGFRIAAEAEDGKQALELARSRHFALILTDIRMPKMNGLELIEKLKEFSEAHVVILSGYEDFEYARQGMKLGVNDYLLKPADEDDLIGVLHRIRTAIEEERLHRRQQQLGLSALQDQFLRKLAHGQAGRGDIEEHERLLGLPLGDDYYALLLVEPDYLHEDDGHLTERDIELIGYAVRNVLEELCGDRGRVFAESEERFGVLLRGRADEVETNAVRELACSMVSAIAKHVGKTVSIGIGERCVRGPSDVPEAFAAAEKSLDGKFLRGGNTVLSLTELSDGSDNDEEIQQLRASVLEAVGSCEETSVREAIGRLRMRFKAGIAAEKRIRAAVVELLVELLQLAKSSGAGTEDLFHSGHGEYERILTMKTADELCAFAEKKCFEVMSLLLRMRDVQPHSVVGTVKSIVQERYRTNLSLRSVAQEVFLNPNYLGKLFKAKTGMSFNDYLLQTRMEKAKRLLLETDMRVYEIAQEVGYGELDWFYKRFKAYAGISAGDYRARLGSGGGAT